MPYTMVINGVPCSIALEDLGENAISESYDESGNASADVIYKCDWANRNLLVQGLKTTVTTIGRTPIRTVPHQYPDNTNLYCMAVGGIKGKKPRCRDDGWVTYEYSYVPAHYARPAYGFYAGDPAAQNDPSGLPWTITKIKVSGEVLTPPDGAFFIGPFPGATKCEENSVGIISADVEISMTRLYVPLEPLNDSMSLQGCTNLYPMQFGNYNFGTGQLLYVGHESTPGSDPAGNYCREVTYTLMGKTNDWGEVISKNGSLQFLNTAADGSGVGPYLHKDLTTLP